VSTGKFFEQFLDVMRRKFGSAADTICQGNDSRLSDARTPTAHKDTHQDGGSDAMDVDTSPSIGSLRTLGTDAQQACAGDDARLSDDRAPTAHASDHENGGSDEISVAGLSGELADPQPAKINGLDADTPVDADEFLFYDAAGHNNKVTGANLKTYIGGAAEVSPIIYPLISAPDTVGAGTWVVAPDTTQPYLWNNTTNDGDNFSIKVRVPAGTYTVSCFYIKGLNRGVLDMDMDGVEIGSVDGYVAVNAYYTEWSVAGVVLTAGEHTIRIRVDGKNPASGDYAALIGLEGFMLKRTA
jgi:hypothetical protein